MYFSVAHSPALLYQTQIADNLWFNSNFVGDNIGYRLNEYGGNFINVNINNQVIDLNFSYYKDYNLGSSADHGILLTNIDSLITTPISPLTIHAHVDSNVLKTKQYNVKTWLTSSNRPDEKILDCIKYYLCQNLKACLELSNSRWIVYTGGLDSSLLAFLAHEHGYDFTALIDQTFKDYWQLPFARYYEETQPSIGNETDYSIKTSFYQSEYNRAITGFFGDLSMLHHGSLYFQVQHLGKMIAVDELYDPEADSTLEKFKSIFHLKQNIIKLTTTTKFRHWFDNFEILDPYRDPVFLDIITQLPDARLINQLGTAWIQKTIIRDLNPDYLKYICRYKNNYEQFL